MFLYSLLTTYAVEKFEPIAKWLSVGVVACLLVVGCILFFAKRNVFAKFAKYALFGAFAYFLVIAVLFFALDIAKNYSDSYAEENWLDKQTLVKLVLVPLLTLASLSLIGLCLFALTAKYRPSLKRKVGVISAVVCTIALIAVFVCIAVYYDKKIVGDGYYNSDTATVQEIALYLSAVLAVAVIIGLALLDKTKLSFDANSLAYAGICTAMSFALSYIKLWDMPAGGSVTLVSLFPLMLFSYVFGAKKGVFVGFVYGVLQAVQDPWIIHPAQFLLDYPVAFSAVGVAGLFRSLPTFKKVPQVKFAIGATVAGALRFICHVLSGALAFEAYAKGQNAWAYSLVYNSYVFIDVALVIAVGIFALSSKSFAKTLEKTSAKSAGQ